MKEANIQYTTTVMSASLVGAEQGVKYKTDNGTIELYEFNKSGDSLKVVKETEKVTFEGFGSFDVIIKDNFAMLLNDYTKTDEIQKIFNDLK